MSHTIKGLLRFSRDVTQDFQKQTHKWTLTEQLAETFSEVSELYQILRHRKPDEAKDEWIEELWDIIFSAIACAHCYPVEITDADLIKGLQRVCDKLKDRMKSNHYKGRYQNQI